MEPLSQEESSQIALDLMKTFFSQLGPTANWTPSEVQNTFIYKRSSLWRKNHKILKAVDEFPTDILFESVKKNNESFLVCISTDHLEGYHEKDENNKTRLLDFLDEYRPTFIWTCGRPIHAPKKTPFSKPILDETYFEILDLTFSSNKRAKKIHVKAPYNDVIMMIIPESNDNVVIMANSEYHYVCRNNKGKMIVKVQSSYKKTFNSKSKAAKKDLGQGGVIPGTSGQSQSIGRSQSISRSQPSGRSQPNDQTQFKSSESSMDRSQIQSNTDKTRPEKTSDNRSGSSQSKESELEPESSFKIKRGRKRKRENDTYNTVKFTSSFITVITDERSQRFPIETVSKENISVRHRKWIGRNEEIRKDQWKKIQMNSDFDLYERVRNDDALSLRFFRFSEIVPQDSIDCCMKEWYSKCRGPFPDNLMYIMYDSSKEIPYLGSFTNLYI